MSTRTLVLEDFATGTPAAEPATGDTGAPAADRAAIYEEGYRAGWDDAAASERESLAHVGADFARTLQDLSFGFHEARAHVLASVAPLLRLITGQLLPDLARARFAETLVATAEPLFEAAADRPVEIVVAPANRAAVEALLGGHGDVPVTLTVEPSLGPGQAYLRGADSEAGAGETALDLDASLARLSEAVERFLLGDGDDVQDTDDTRRAANG